MDNQKTSKDFDKILNTGGWIETKNVDGQLKVAACGEDLTCAEDFMPVDDDNTEEVKLKTEFNKEFNIAQLFINDIIKSTKSLGYFTFKNLKFGCVYICGTVTLVSIFINKRCFLVNDGTGSIRCIIEDDFMKEKRQNFTSSLQESYEAFKENPDSTLLKATVILKRNTKKIMDKVPVITNVKQGDQVKIIGKVKEFNDTKYVFIQKIMMLDDGEELQHYRETLLQIYENGMH